MRRLAVFFVFAAGALALAGCGEEPQVLEAAQRPGYRTDGGSDQLRERTARQSENERIYQ